MPVIKELLRLAHDMTRKLEDRWTKVPQSNSPALERPLVTSANLHGNHFECFIERQRVMKEQVAERRKLPLDKAQLSTYATTRRAAQVDVGVGVTN